MTEIEKENEWLKQKLQETECSPNCQWQKENEELKESVARSIDKALEWKEKCRKIKKENEELKAKLEKIKKVISCDNCKHNYEHIINMCPYYNCNLEKWELAE